MAAHVCSVVEVESNTATGVAQVFVYYWHSLINTLT
jgi:hypothetical protein